MKACSPRLLRYMVLCLGSMCWAAGVWAQASNYRILMVLPRAEQNIEAGFRDYLQRRNVPARIEVLRYSGRSEDASALVEQVRRLRPDLIYSWGTVTTLALAGPYDSPQAERYIRDIPIVFTEVTDPVGSRLLQQLNPPGRNVTGVSHVAPLPVQLKTMQSYRPFKRLGYLVNPAEPNTVLVLKNLQSYAQESGFEIVTETVSLDAAGNPDPQSLPGLIERIAAKKAEFLYIGPSTFLAFTHRDLVTQSALKAGLPTFCATESIVRQAKCMFGLFSNGSNIGRFAAYKAAQVLVDRVPVQNIAAETLQRFSLLINMPTVKTLDLYPPLVLLNVAEVVK